MVLDSPRGRELDEENSKMILNMIKERLSDNQIIVASIYKDMVYDNVIFIDKYAIEEHKQSNEWLYLLRRKSKYVFKVFK